MKRFAYVLVMAAIALPAAVAQDSVIADLKAEKTGLEAKKKELQGQYDKAKAALLASDSFGKEKAAIEKAEKALQERKQTDKDLAKARTSVAAAQQELNDVIAKKASSTKEVQSVTKEVADLESKVPELQFRKRLLQINLNHEGSPAQLELAEDKAVVEAQNALAAAEQAARANPSDQVVAARKAMAKPDEAFRKAQREIAEEKAIRKAGEAVAAASAELREVESKDKARAAAAKMREDFAKVRQEALQRTSGAKSYLKELEETAAQRKELEGLRRGLAYIMDVNRKAIREGKDKNVVKATEAVAKAQKTLDKESDSRDINKARKAADEAAKTFDEKHNEWFAGLADYKQLTAKEDDLQKKLAAMDKDALDASSVRSLKKLIPDMQKIREEMGEIAAKKREIRISTGKEKWDAIYRARGDAAHAVKVAIAASSDAAEASAALAAAQDALAKAVDAAMAGTKTGAACLEMQKELAIEAKKLAFKDAIASHHIGDGNSTIKMAMDKDSKLVKALAELQEQEKELREKPSGAIVKAHKALQEAQAEATQARAKFEQGDDFKKAAAARQAAEQELRKAEAADPARAKVEEAKKALEQKRAETLAGMKAAKKLMEEIKQIDDELASLQTAKSKAADLQRQAVAKVAATEDKDIAAAKKGIEDAKAAVKKAEEGKAFQELQEKIKEAKDDLEKAKKDAEAKDKGLVAIKKQIDEVTAKIDAIPGKIKDAEKKIADEKAAAAKKAADEKKAAEKKAADEKAAADKKAADAKK